MHPVPSSRDSISHPAARVPQTSSVNPPYPPLTSGIAPTADRTAHLAAQVPHFGQPSHEDRIPFIPTNPQNPALHSGNHVVPQSRIPGHADSIITLKTNPHHPTVHSVGSAVFQASPPVFSTTHSVPQSRGSLSHEVSTSRQSSHRDPIVVLLPNPHQRMLSIPEEKEHQAPQSRGPADTRRF